MVLLTILHQYIGAANIKKICEIGLLVLPVCISLPIFCEIGSFLLIYWCYWLTNLKSVTVVFGIGSVLACY